MSYAKSSGRDQSTEDAERTEGRRELRSYVRGLALALLLTFAAFAMVRWNAVPRPWLLPGIGVLALAQIVVHLRFFLHIGLSKQKREDLQLILFSALLLAIMAGGTIWIMSSLAGRMGEHGM